MPVLILKRPRGEVGYESWNQASDPRGVVAEPRKEVKWLLANSVSQS